MLGVDRGTFGSEPYLVSIGNHVTVTAGVRFVTHDGGVWVLRDKYPDIDVVGRVTVHDNVFLGLGSILMPNIEIGPNAVVAAGSVVTRSVSEGSVVGGVPAKPIRSVSEYETGVLQRAINIRSAQPDVKKNAFLKHTAVGRENDEA